MMPRAVEFYAQIVRGKKGRRGSFFLPSAMTRKNEEQEMEREKKSRCEVTHSSMHWGKSAFFLIVRHSLYVCCAGQLM
jgi:hypothetical protein